LFIRLLSKNFLLRPSGLLKSNLISPLKPITSFKVSANSLIVHILAHWAWIPYAIGEINLYLDPIAVAPLNYLK
jgi:hypothetical protein